MDEGSMVQKFKKWHSSAESEGKKFHIKEYEPPSVNYRKAYVYEVNQHAFSKKNIQKINANPKNGNSLC